MSNVMKELKAEISRLAKKEAKAVVSPVKKASATYRGLIAGLRKQIVALQKEVAVLRKAVPSPEMAIQAKTEPEGRFWITGKGVRKLRQRLGQTQANFGKLIGVSVPTVVNWEGVDGKVEIRKKTTMARLQQIKGMGKKEVAEMMGTDVVADAPKKAKAVKKSKAVKAPKKAKKARKAKGPKASTALKAPKNAKAPKASKKSKALKKVKTPKAPKAPKVVEKVEEKPVVETPAEVKKD